MSFLRFGLTLPRWVNIHDIALHPVDSPDEWPNDIHSLAQLMQKPLPAWIVSNVVSQDAPAVSDTSSLGLPNFAMDDRTATSSDRSPFKAEFEFALSLCRFCKFVKHWDPNANIEHLWTRLIGRMLEACAPDVSALKGYAFALPRNSNATIPFSDVMKGSALLIVSCVPQILPRPDHIGEEEGEEGDHTSEDDHSNADEDMITDVAEADKDDASEDEDDATEDDIVQYDDHNSEDDTGSTDEGVVETEDDDASEDEDTTAEDKCSIESSKSDRMLNMHLLVSPPCPDPAVPIICVADTENIIPLITSAVYQRHALRIDEPVIGISICPTGSTCRILFGWMDHAAYLMSNMPVVQIAMASSEVLPANGTFDLMDPISVSALANFLLGLGTHATRIKDGYLAGRQMISQDKGHILSWRSDQVQDISGEEWSLKMATWLNNIEPLRNTSRTHPLDIEMAPKSANSKGSTTGKDKAAAASKAIPPNAVPPVLKMSSTKAASTAPSSTYSLSSFAKKTTNPLSSSEQDPFNMQGWLMDHHVLKVPRLETGEFSNIVKVYNNLVAKFELPSDDKEVPNVDIFLAYLRNQAVEKLSTADHVTETDRRVFDELRDRISLAIYAAQMSLDCYELERRLGAYEADHKKAWGHLFSVFGHTSNEAIGAVRVDPLSERMLQLPRIGLYDSLVSSTGISDQHPYSKLAAMAGEYVIRTSIAMVKMQPEIPDRDLTQLVRLSSREVWEYSERMTKWSRHPKDAQESLLKRCKAYPERGICDLVLTTSIPGFRERARKAFDSDELADSFLKEFVLIARPADNKRMDDPREKVQGHQNNATGSNEHRPINKDEQKLLENTFATAATVADEPCMDILLQHQAQKPKPGSSSEIIVDADLILPILLVEYKRNDGSTYGSALNQSRAYATSAVKFLALLGIKDFPVYSLATEGAVGVVWSTWFSDNDQCVYMMERGARAFDISKPEDALHFAAFLRRLQDHAKDLHKRFEDVKEDFYKLFQTEEGRKKLNWTKIAQAKQYQWRVKSFKPKGEDKVGEGQVGISAQ